MTKEFVAILERLGENERMEVDYVYGDSVAELKGMVYQNFHRDGNLWISDDGFTTIGRVSELQEYMT